MAQVTPPIAPANASLPGLGTPGRPEQSRNVGVRTSSTDDVSQVDENLEAEAQEQRRDADVKRVQRQMRSRASERGNNLDILV